MVLGVEVSAVPYVMMGGYEGSTVHGWRRQGWQRGSMGHYQASRVHRHGQMRQQGHHEEQSFGTYTLFVMHVDQPI